MQKYVLDFLSKVLALTILNNGPVNTLYIRVQLFCNATPSQVIPVKVMTLDDNLVAAPNSFLSLQEKGKL